MDKVNILLVDDQPAKLLTYEVILADLGDNLIKASSAREALEQLLRTEIAVVLTDVSMPETDGFELAAMIREHPRFRRTAIIFVSAIHLTDPDRLRGYEAGAVDYLPVPLIPELMRAKVKVFAELYRKTRELERLNAELERRVVDRTAELALANARLEQRVEERTREREAALAQVHEMQKMESLGQLTGGVAHDFNNLLMAVTANLELLRKRLPNDSDFSRLIDGALAGAERGSTLTKRMLAFARRQELKPKSVQLKALIENMEDLLKRSVGPLVSISTSIDRQLPAVLVDPHQLELALINLALNARDAMPNGGEVVIAAHRAQSGLQPLELTDGDYVSLLVSDTGVGMDETTLSRAIEPFFTTKGVGKGTGLGLSMVQGVVAQSGGALQIQSEVGQGTQVHLWLPVDHSGIVAAQGQSKNIVSSETQPIQIVLVDDDPLILSTTAAMLEDLGHIVTPVSSGAEALDVLRTMASMVQVVVSDYAMPGFNGLQLARLIHKQWPWLSVILASGYAEHIDSSDSALERLSKPYSQADMAECIKKVIKNRNVIPVASGPHA